MIIKLNKHSESDREQPGVTPCLVAASSPRKCRDVGSTVETSPLISNRTNFPEKIAPSFPETLVSIQTATCFVRYAVYKNPPGALLRRRMNWASYGEELPFPKVTYCYFGVNTGLSGGFDGCQIHSGDPVCESFCQLGIKSAAFQAGFGILQKIRFFFHNYGSCFLYFLLKSAPFRRH